MQSYSDDNLMLAVSQGQLSSMGMLFERYHVRLYQYFLRLIGNGDLAEDLTQEVFYRILKYRSSYKSSTPFRLWIFRIARNVANDHFAKKGELVSQDTVPEPAVEYDAIGQITRQDQVDQLKRAFAQLSEDKREVLIQSRYCDMKYTDIARVTDSTVSAVKVRVHRAIKDLRDVFFRASKDKEAAS